ncbi:hypothetical protein PMZ80_001073 [Knufia obscura]|uniref:Uncharacterized protein n=1 Tax=Knufia obscura TaxID=1635080 RepID=A0ABR0S369_9EURO|nr:hypothetical protein PMZ80_001073 [Knufia obscura]
MGKTKTKSRNNSKDILRSANAPLVKSAVASKSQKSTEDLLAEAATLLEHSQPEQALPLIQEALKRLETDKQAYSDIDILLHNAAQEKATFPTALVLGADVCSALGDIDKARAQYELAVQIDPNGALVSAEPYLELAQLSEEGGRKSIDYFEKAVEVMKNEIEVLDEQLDIEGTQQIVDMRRAKVAEALCGMAEVYMTDLSWEEDAEQRCEQLVTEAIAICPESLSAGVLQTLASIRISQDRLDEAKRTLAQSLAIWKGIPADVEDPARPDFATRVSLVRLLMEVEHEQDAMVVLEGLVKEDDQSVEAWYLGGWCHLLISQKPDIGEDAKSANVQQAQEWLANCLKLYQILQYEDEPLRSHAEELVRELNRTLNIEGDEDEWEDADDDENASDGDNIEAIDDDHARDEDVEMT